MVELLSTTHAESPCGVQYNLKNDILILKFSISLLNSQRDRIIFLWPNRALLFVARDDEVDQVDHGTTSPLLGYVQLYAISSAISSATVELFSVEDDTICAQIRMLYTFFFRAHPLEGNSEEGLTQKMNN